MADIFGRPNTGFAGAYDSSGASLTFSGAGALTALLAENVNLTYSQQLARVYELAGDAVYLIVGRTQGNGSIGSVIGPKNVSQALYSDLGNPCKQNNITFTFKIGGSSGRSGNKCQTGSIKRIAEGCVLQQTGFQVTAQDMLIRETLTMEYAALKSA